MKRLLGFIVAITGLAMLPLGAQNSLSLDSAVTEAFVKGSDATILKERLEVAAGLEEEARAHLWPQLSLRASYTQTNGALNGFGMILSQRSFDNLVNFNAPGRLDNAAAGLDFNYRVYAGGTEQARWQAAVAQHSAAEKEVQAELDALTLAVVRAYLDIRQASQTKVTLQNSQVALQASWQIAQAAETAGRMLRVERLNVEVQLAQIAQQLLVTDAWLALSKRRLLILIGRDQNDVLTLAPLAPIIKLPELRTTLMQVRPEVLAMQLRVQMAESNLQAVQGGYLPTVDVQASYEYDQGWLRSGLGTNWTAGVVGRYRLWDGRQNQAQERVARAELRAAEAKLHQVEAEMAFDLERARLMKEQVEQRLKLVTLAASQAEESVRLTRERFKVGKVLSNELIAVEARWAETKLQVALTEGEQVATQIALRRALGLPLFSK
jgi:outer membrane protein TolC